MLDELDIAPMHEPEPGWEEVLVCPICEATPQHFMMWQTPVTKMRIGDAVVGLTTPIPWSECPNCEVEYQKVRLTRESLDYYYRSDQYRRLINQDNEEFRDENSLRYAKAVMEFLEEVGVTATRQLDYGSGTGALLRSVPWDGVGVEISENATKWSRERGVEVFGTLGEVEGTFDFITIIETLEHLPNPVATLEALMEYLEPGGHILIGVPWSGKHSGDKTQIGHLFSFALPSMMFLTEKVGIIGKAVSEMKYSETGVALFFLGVKDAE